MRHGGWWPAVFGQLKMLRWCAGNWDYQLRVGNCGYGHHMHGATVTLLRYCLSCDLSLW